MSKMEFTQEKLNSLLIRAIEKNNIAAAEYLLKSRT